MQPSLLVRLLAMLSPSLVPTQEPPAALHAGSGLLDRIHSGTEPFGVILDVNTQNFTYQGDVRLPIKVIDSDREEPKNLIVLHADPSLDIREITYSDRDATPRYEKHTIEIVKREHNSTSQLLSITLAKDLPDGASGTLSIKFSAKARSDNRGIYRHQPSAEDNSLMKAYFSNSGARLAIPCFDEPTFEPVNFIISVTSELDTIATSSSLALRSRMPLRGRRLTMFERTETPILVNSISFEVRPNPDDPNGDLHRNLTDLKNQPYMTRFMYDLMYNPKHDPELLRDP